jgi:hypothetical protein
MDCAPVSSLSMGAASAIADGDWRISTAPH